MTGLDLKVERTRLGLKQYRLAAALGVPPTIVWQIESGRRPVSADQANSILRTMRDLAAQEQSRPGNDLAA